MKILILCRLRLIPFVLVLILCNSVLLFGSEKTPIQINAVRFEHSVQYPSLIPIYYLRITYLRSEKASDEELTQLLSNIGNWQISLKRNDQKITLSKDVVQRVDLGNHIDTLYILLNEGALQKGDEITEVRIGNATYSKPVKVSVSVPKWAFSIDPKEAPNEELTDGTKKTATQVGIKLDIPQLATIPDFAHVFVSSDNLLSTENKDKSSKVEFKIGAERSLLKAYYSPASVNVEFIGNQAFSNASVVTSADTKWLLPWRWTDPIFWNDAIKAPISPFIALAVQYENRLKKDASTDVSHAKDNLFRINGELHWSPIYLLTGENNPLTGMKLEFTAKGWYFPDEKATGGASVRRFESNINTALYIPMPEWITSDKGAMFKMEYDNGANEANGFVRSSSIKFGVQYSKVKAKTE